MLNAGKVTTVSAPLILALKSQNWSHSRQLLNVSVESSTVDITSFCSCFVQYCMYRWQKTTSVKIFSGFKTINAESDEAAASCEVYTFFT